MLTYILLGWALQSTFYVVANLNYNLNLDFAFPLKHSLSLQLGSEFSYLYNLIIYSETVLNFRKNNS